MKPSWTACIVSEYAPEIKACEAMMAAQVASTMSGYKAHWGASR
jgi:hypothetical protein